MGTNRLEAFSDGVIAIIITIMVLEMKVPHDPDIEALLKLWPVFVSYALSFLIVAIYWVNHHHLLHELKRVNAKVLWLNNLLLFCMSLMPFVTGYMGENHFTRLSVSIYSVVAFASALAFLFLRRAIEQSHGHIAQELREHRNRKMMISLNIYLAAIIAAWFWVPLALALLVLPAIMYFLPGKRAGQFIE
ncbi:MAG: TMEM175 family protein [Burkholderiales bacterium]